MWKACDGCIGMSEEEGGFGVSFTERLFGLVIFLVGVTALYYVWTSLQVLAEYGWFFAFLNIILIGIGLVLMTAKTE
jgi:uncharacterized membrane protein YiaA